MVPNEISKLELIQARISFIPEGWKLDKVGEALNIKNNFRKPISQEVRSLIPGPYPYYGPTKIQDHIADYEQDGIYALIGEDGDHFLKYETMRQTQFISGKCTVNNHAHIIESSDTCDSEWFYIYFQYRNITNFLSRQGAGRFKLNKATLEKLPLLVPPLPEQQKIAKILSTWDKAISTTERLIENSTQQKKALMQQLLTGKKRLLDDNGERFEGDWENQSIENLTTRVGDGIHSTPKYTDKSSIRFVNGNNLNNGSIVFSDLTKFVDEDDAKNHYRNLSSRTILMSINGTIGNLAIYNNENIVLGKSACYINVKEEIDVLFIFYKLASSEVQSHFISRLTGSTIKNLSLTTIKSTQVALPSLKEQQKITTVLTNADKEIELLEQQLADLQQEKKALMQVLLTGKKRVVVDG